MKTVSSTSGILLSGLSHKAASLNIGGSSEYCDVMCKPKVMVVDLMEKDNVAQFLKDCANSDYVGALQWQRNNFNEQYNLLKEKTEALKRHALELAAQKDSLEKKYIDLARQQRHDWEVIGELNGELDKMKQACESMRVKKAMSEQRLKTKEYDAMFLESKLFKMEREAMAYGKPIVSNIELFHMIKSTANMIHEAIGENEIGKHVIPGVDEIRYLQADILLCVQMENSIQVLIHTFAYLDRLLENDDIYMTSANWVTILVVVSAMAAKYVEESLIMNADFVSEHVRSSYNVDINTVSALECAFLQVLDYNLHLTPEVYKQYYNAIMPKSDM
eukprot:CAMPEP_0168526034 /NCGR_PEP_ID=MMETSP0405-20121227/11695_1 /TAXON_ID=498012 /ORGANISM="Trichosphaerium sp, Strain Am-I-7 wt" /LENGTH=331 /DNA_ID=CAMNT_0008548735 /DNA_START=34 /DNA_END=1029 /DNA_ORIENTATION=+